MKLIRKPSVKRYPGQNKSQEKRLTLNKDGDVILDFNPEIGSLISVDQWHNVTPTISFPGFTLTANIIAFYQENKPLFERVFAGRTIQWRALGHIGTYTPDAEKALEQIEYLSTKVV